MIDAYASLPHYWRHLAPILAACGDLRRAGEVWSNHDSHPWGSRLPRDASPNRVTLVASWDDASAVHNRQPHRPLVYVEHGAGQTYVDRPEHPAFSGGARAHRDAGIVGYVVPHETVAARIRAARPDAAVAVVGCPALDTWLTLDRWRIADVAQSATIAVTFHWPNTLCPESMWALPHWERHLRDVIATWRRSGYQVIGHAHPKAVGYLEPVWRRLGVEFVPDVDVVLARARILVADNTSLMYEWAALGRPVVALASPLWRRDVIHGLRFWNLIPGPEFTDARLLADFPLVDLYDAEWTALRERVAAEVYAAPHPWPTASAAAAAFVLNLEAIV